MLPSVTGSRFLRKKVFQLTAAPDMTAARARARVRVRARARARVRASA